MGNNYYVKVGTKACEHCSNGTVPEVLHIGKSSAGWCFALHAMASEYAFLCSPDAWFDFLGARDCECKIYDDYDRPVTLAALKELITAKSKDKKNNIGGGSNCVAHVDGCDIIGGEFS